LLISFISVSLILITLFVYFKSELSHKEQIEKIEKQINGDDFWKYPLTRILVAQYLYNKGADNLFPKRSYNDFPPYCYWYNTMDLHLSGYRQIQLAGVLERDLAVRYRRNYIIDSPIGSIKYKKKDDYIVANVPIIAVVARAEKNRNLPLPPIPKQN
jgi:hypothetical protein